MDLVFSGIQPTGNLNIGNYLGAIRNFVALQESYDCLYCVVDLHAITVWQEPSELADHTRSIAATYMAAGVDPKKQIIFNQSQVSEHAELAWIMNCVVRIGWLNRMTQFKDKAGKSREKASAGLYVYPSLMAADILLYRATHVPVGDDQKQHVEIARDMAQKFNSDFKTDYFPIPEPLIMADAPRIMSLRDGTKKMSKSDPSDNSRINLLDSPDEIAHKIRRARTDADPLPACFDDLEGRPEARNLITIYAALGDEDRDDVCREFEGALFSDFKAALVERTIETFAPIASEMRKLMADPGYIDDVLANGAARARAIADPNLQEIYDIVGFLRPGHS